MAAAKKDTAPVPVVLAEILAERAEKHPPIVIDLGDGEPLSVPSIAMWDDDLLDEFDADPVVGARRLLGADDYARFKAAGGTAVVLRDIVLRQARESSLGK